MKQYYYQFRNFGLEMVENCRAEKSLFVGLRLSLLMYLGQDHQQHPTLHSGGASRIPFRSSSAHLPLTFRSPFAPLPLPFRSLPLPFRYPLSFRSAGNPFSAISNRFYRLSSVFSPFKPCSTIFNHFKLLSTVLNRF